MIEHHEPEGADDQKRDEDVWESPGVYVFAICVVSERKLWMAAKGQVSECPEEENE